MKTYKINIFNDCIQILNSYKIKYNEFKNILEELIKENPDHQVFVNRNRYGLLMEFSVHNFLYKFGFFKLRTINLELEYPIKLKNDIIYKIIGPFCRLFID